jgi:hypothetical protein
MPALMSSYLIGFQALASAMLLCSCASGGARTSPVMPADAPRGPMEVLRTADEARRRGNLDEALATYLWCVDHCLELDDTFTGVWSTGLARRLGELAVAHPAAARQADALRSDFARRLQSGEVRDVSTAMFFLELDRSSPGPPIRGEVYHRMLLPRSPSKVALFRAYFDELYEAGDFDDIVEMSWVVDEEVRELGGLAFRARGPEEAALVRMGMPLTTRRSARTVHALEASGRSDAATLLALVTFTVDGSKEAGCLLLRAAWAAGSPGLEENLRSAGARDELCERTPP